MKLKNWWGISTLILTTIGTAIPVALTTSCVEKRDWVFNNYGDIDNYLQQHKQNVSEGHIFKGNLQDQNDYDFIKKNMNFQLIINSALLTASLRGKVFDYGKAELHIKNKTTAEIDYRSPKPEPEPEPVVASLEAAIDPEPVEIVNWKVVMEYDDFLFTIEQFYEGEIYVHAIGSYNFKKDLSLEDGNEHSYYLYQSYSDLLEGIEFYDSNTMSMSLPCYSFPYDWTNHSLLVISSFFHNS